MDNFIIESMHIIKYYLHKRRFKSLVGSLHKSKNNLNNEIFL